MVTVGSAGSDPREAAETLGVRHLVIDGLGCPMMRGRDYVAVQRADLLVQTMWGWAGLVSVIADRIGVPCDSEVRATCVAVLLEQHATKMKSGVLRKYAT